MAAERVVESREQLVAWMDEGLSLAGMEQRGKASKATYGNWVKKIREERAAVFGQLHPRDVSTDAAKIAPYLEHPNAAPDIDGRVQAYVWRRMLDEANAVLTYDRERGFNPAPRSRGEKGRYVRPNVTE